MDKKRGKKIGSAITDILPWLILALFLLGLLMVYLFVLKGNNVDLIAQIKNLFRVG